MKQLNIADELFNQLRQVKMLFANDMAVYSSGRPVGNDPADYVAVLRELYKAMGHIGLYLEGMEQNIEDLYSRSGCLGDLEKVPAFFESFYGVIGEMLSAIVRYREYYCIIQRDDQIPGLASHMITNLGHMAMAISEGYIPVIDMVNADNSFAGLSRSLGKNAWELFFQQPFDKPLPSPLPAHRHIVRKGIPPVMPNYDMDFLTNPALVDRWRRLVKKHMPFSPEWKGKLDLAAQSGPFHTGSRVLGVLCRGTDYTLTRPYNHPVQPTINEALAKAEEAMGEHGCKYLYLATEDPKILSAFQERFRGALFVTQDIYYPDMGGGSLNDANKKLQIDLYRKNEEYLTALYLLSRCHCLIGGRTSGTVMALLFASRFDYFYVWNKGRYGVDDTFTVLF